MTSKSIALTTYKIVLNSVKRRLCTMSSLKCFVRHVEDDNDLSISFQYSSAHINETILNFKRSKDEEVGKLFSRMAQNISNKMTKKLNKKKSKDEKEELPQISIALKFNGVNVEEHLKNSDVWREGSILVINQLEYKVMLNTPCVKSLKLPKSIMAGFEVHPTGVFEFCSIKQSQFNWYKQRLPHEKHAEKVKRRQRNRSSGSSSGEDNVDCEASEEVVGYGGWIHVSNEFYYQTNSDDIGRKLKLVCIPSDGTIEGLPVEVISPNCVEAGPGLCPYEERHCFTSDVTPFGSFRITCYNILADLYADSDYSRSVLYPHCPPYALNMDYRKQLLIKEIIGYNADVCFLQEVDTKIFTHDLEPIMNARNFNCIFSEKGGQVVEGLACFYNTSKFDLINSSTTILADALQSEPLFNDIFNKIKANEKLLERVVSRTTVFQCVLLESKELVGRALLCGNTHLYFHPDSDHIRLLQASLCLKLMESKIQEYKMSKPHLIISPIICGDFNSCPEFGVYQLMTTGYVPEDLPDWSSNSDEIISGLSISQSLTLSSACGTPEYTHFTPGFYGCLDYIFYDTNHLTVSEVIPLPGHEQVIQHTALPNIVFPSDHLAIVCTLKWKQQNPSIIN